jgi:hypothetical protein
VLTDPYYPGWRAYVDGVESPILRADYLFRAVALGPGAHVVRFVFTPRSLERGMALSLAGAVIAVGAILIGLGGPLFARRPWRLVPWRRLTVRRWRRSRTRSVPPEEPEP